MPQDLKKCVVSIRSIKKKGNIVGTGFVVDARHILTCAHVVDMANAGHGDELLVVFAANDRKQRVTVLPQPWRAAAQGNIALLKLTQPLLDDVEPVRMWNHHTSAHRRFASFGYVPLGDMAGIGASGTIITDTIDTKGIPWLQLDSKQADKGLSGAPILDLETDRVVGMFSRTWTGATGANRDTCFATPITAIHAIWPELTLTEPTEPATPNPETLKALTPYLKVLAERSRNLPLAPLDPKGQGSTNLALRDIFINSEGNWLKALKWPVEHIKTEQADWEKAWAAKKEDDSPDWLRELSGLDSDLNESEDGLTAAWTTGLFVPVFVELHNLAQTEFDPHSPLAIWQYVQAQLRQNGLENSIPALDSLIQNGQLLLLPDGVDEVPLERRKAVWQAIAALADGPLVACRWVATCRILSFVRAETPADVPAFTLSPLTEAQIDRFIAGWYAVLGSNGVIRPEQVDQMTDALQTAARRERLRPLANNPMLLTIMAIVQTYYGTLPQERARLYQVCVETLLLRWQRHKEDTEAEMPDVLTQLGTTKETLERLLWEIVWQAHRRAANREEAADIAETELMHIAKKLLGSYAKAEQFLIYTERRAHLLVGRGGKEQRIFTFPHRTFQEYLAACYIASRRDFNRDAPHLAERGDTWREVLNLATGTLVFNQNNREKALDGIDRVLPRRVPNSEKGWLRVWRAAEMVLVVGLEGTQQDEVGRELLPRLRKLLALLVMQGQLTPVQRAEAGDALGVIGDPRKDVACTIPAMVEIPTGPFLMRSDKAKDPQASDREKPRHTVNLPMYRIGKYPVTNAQFKAFMKAGGYENRVYWTDAGWKRREADGWTGPRFWHDARYNGSNQPVIGVNWYEAVAYCNWLQASTGCHFRLPDEAMWEKAARGKYGRIYPWGNDWDPNRLNAGETGSDRPCAVGIFPGGKSVFGIFDASGNVWEWCCNNQLAYPFQPQDYATDIKEAQFPGLRGGAFFDSRQSTRAAYRTPSGWGIL